MNWRFFVPGDSAAVALGADQVADGLRDAASRKGVDIEIVRTGSRGMHWLEPLVEIETAQGHTAFGPVEASDVESVFAAVTTGTPHRLAIGKPEDHPFLKGQKRLTFERCGIVDPASLADYKAHGGYRGLERALAAGPDAIVATVTQSGLRGRGGAGFPTGIKWDTVAKTPEGQKYVVCNADEGDSGTFADRMIMEGDPFLLIEGMTIAGIAVGATEGYIYVRSEYPLAIRALETALAAARKGGMLGGNLAGSHHTFDIEVRVGAGAYVCGEETS
jgi:formate dehydrogenase iron-sulfur subunit